MTENAAVAEPIESDATTDTPDDREGAPAKGLTEDQLKAKRYSAEAASWRKKLRTAEARIKELEAGLGSGDDAGDDNGSPTGQKRSPSYIDSELASLRRQVKEANAKVEDISGKWTKAEEKARRVAHENLAGRIVAGLNSPNTAIELLLSKTKLSEDEKTIVYTTKDKETGEMVEVEVTKESLKSSGLLDSIFFPAEGANGNGTGTTAPVTGRGHKLDLSKIDDAAYFKEHREEILALRGKPKRA
ncbi:MAG TPA: hypothetical protein PLB01_00265 [Thermoanaerobaculia bacterium]|nr:hypothetical protein [Thermoanaerobaculia bacterium]